MINIEIKKNPQKLIIIILLIFLFLNNDHQFLININYIEKNNEKTYRLKHKIQFDKWIVITAFKPPSEFIINLEKNITDWKIVVIGNNKTNDIKWNIFKNSKILYYISINEQYNLNYKVLEYLKENSYFRKCIGYLYAIENGAKEIFEIDEDLIFSDMTFLNNHFENSRISYGTNNESIQINPYSYFGNFNIWPRGFKLKDIGKQSKNEFHYIKSSHITLKPLIYQGLINNFPDIDSIYYLTKVKLNNSYHFNISQSYPLLYFPNYFIPINSKHTRYLYDIFPFLMFPTSIAENIADIWRGYLMQKISWSMKGVVIYYNTDSFRKLNDKDIFNINIDKNIYYGIDEFLDILNSQFDNYNAKNPFELFNYLINTLVEKKIFNQRDKKLYKAFEKDLINIGYNFSQLFSIDIKLNNSNYLKINIEKNLYIPSKILIIKNEFYKLINHFTSSVIYKDILLIINYNSRGYLNLNEYIISLYKNYFHNIVFIYPSNINVPNIIGCEESSNGYYLYKCFNKVYKTFPYFKGYLIINDDVFLKTWELINFNFDIPWMYHYCNLDRSWNHYKRCYKIFDIIGNNTQMKKNLIGFNGFYDALQGKADLFYFPNYYAKNIVYLFDRMFNSRLFLECAIPTSIGIILAKKYQIIYIKPLETIDERKNVIDFLFSNYNQISIHPIKFSNKEYQKKINEYIFFMNAIKF